MKKLSLSRCRVCTMGSQTEQVLTLGQFKSDQQTISLYWVLKVCHVVDRKAMVDKRKSVYRPPGKLKRPVGEIRLT